MDRVTKFRKRAQDWEERAGKLPTDERRSLLTTKGDLQTPCGLASGNSASRAAGPELLNALGV
jgi:hypothetical protein